MCVALRVVQRATRLIDLCGDIAARRDHVCSAQGFTDRFGLVRYVLTCL